MDSFGHGLVFNMISQKIESYAPDAIALNHKFLLPIFAKGNGLDTPVAKAKVGSSTDAAVGAK
jgi:hypothetical protein